MSRLYSPKYLVLAVAMIGTLPPTSLADTTGRSPYNARAEITYDEIFDFEVRSFPLRMAHPYQIVIPNTELGQVIACNIYQGSGTDTANSSPPRTPGLAALFAKGSDGVKVNNRRTSMDLQFVNSGHGETHVHFSHKIEKATFRCFNAHIELSD